MEVLRHGDTYKEVECKKCGALLSYCKNDVIRKFDCSEVFGELHSYSEEYVACPECKKVIMLSRIIDGKETVKQ